MVLSTVLITTFATVKSFKADDSSISPSSERFETLYSGQFTLSTQLIISSYPVILFHRYSATVSLETYPLYSSRNGLDFTCKWLKPLHTSFQYGLSGPSKAYYGDTRYLNSILDITHHQSDPVDKI